MLDFDNPSNIYLSGTAYTTGVNINSLPSRTYYRRIASFDNIKNTSSRSTISKFSIDTDTSAPTVVYTGATPANGTITSGNMFTGQLDISGYYLNQFIRNRNGNKYSLYDSGLVLMYNFNNISALGESA